VLYLSNPEGYEDGARRRFLDDLSHLNQLRAAADPDPEIAARVGQYEMAYRMQHSVPELTDLSKEPESTFELYGPDSRTPGTYAANCILARRMAERGVRFTQVYKRGWDVHDNVTGTLPILCRETDRGCYALVTDLKRRGLLDDTLVIWAGEFGRTVYSQGGLTPENYGRDHHPRCYSLWLAGGGIKPGITYGETDDYCYNIVRDPVHIHDYNATILHLMGIEHTKLEAAETLAAQNLAVEPPARTSHAVEMQRLLPVKSGLLHEGA